MGGAVITLRRQVLLRGRSLECAYLRAFLLSITGAPWVSFKMADHSESALSKAVMTMASSEMADTDSLSSASSAALAASKEARETGTSAYSAAGQQQHQHQHQHQHQQQMVHPAASMYMGGQAHGVRFGVFPRRIAYT